MPSATGVQTRRLLACAKCERQFDAADLAEGSLFRCACSAVLKVPHFRPHDAAVVRCSSCAAPRREAAPSCEHCGADFTSLELDLHTICPGCMTRVSDRARFCHHCAKPIVPQGLAGVRTKQGCPACGLRHKLNSRSLGDPAVSVLECPRCAGLWLSHEGFDVVRDKARREAPPADAPPSATRPAAASAGPAGGESLYRRCPVCRKYMNRRNYGGTSAVVLDSCRDHGSWFDAKELEQVLSWTRGRGEERAEERLAEERRQRERAQRFRLDRESRATGAGSFSPTSEPASGDLLRNILGTLFDL